MNTKNYHKTTAFNIKSLQEKMAYTLSLPLNTESFELVTENYLHEFLSRIQPLSEDITAVYQAGTYNRQYWLRLINCMQEQFPLLLCIMGLANFNRLAIKYLTAHPSEDPNLNRLGKQLFAYIRNFNIDFLNSKKTSHKIDNLDTPSSMSSLKVLRQCAEMETIYNELFIKEEKTGLNFQAIMPHLKKLGEKRFFFREDVFGFHHEYLLQPHLLIVRQKSFSPSTSKLTIDKKSNAFFMFAKGKQVHCISATPMEITLFKALKSGQSLNDAMDSLLQEKKTMHLNAFIEGFMEKIGMFEWLESIE